MTQNIQVVEAEGILDGNRATQIRREISECLQKKADIILLDFKAVTFIDSSGLGALVAALKTVRSAEAQLYICSICDQVKILFELTSMNRVFQVFPDRATFEKEILS
jgi:anti-anti-sigma factor